MIDTDKYEGHTPAPWDVSEAGINRIMVYTDNVYTDNENFAYEEAEADAALIADAPLLLEAYKRLRKLEAAVVGSWMETINRGSNWHKQLRDPCVELGYLTYNAKGWANYKLSEEYQNMAKEWVKEHYGDDEE